MLPYFGPAKPTVAGSFEAVRTLMVMRVLHLFWILALPALIAQLARAHETGWQPSMTVSIIGTLALWSLYLSRTVLSVRVLALSILAILLARSCSAYLSFGLSGLGPLYSVLSVLLATLFFGLRGGIVTIAAVATLLGGLTVAVGTQQLRFAVDFHAYSVSVLSWTTFTINLVVTVGAAILAGGTLYAALVEAVRASSVSEDRYRRIVDTAMEGIFQIDTDDRIIFVNQQMADLAGYTLQELEGMPIASLRDAAGYGAAEERQRARRVGALPRAKTESKLLRKDGSERWIHVSTVTLLDDRGAYSGTLGMVSDIEERKQAEEDLRHALLNDALTGLPNRALLTDRLDQGIAQAGRSRMPLALLVLDLDRFKDLNDSFGHDVGDRVLCSVASRLRGALRESCTVSRLGGDEYALVLPDEDALAAAMTAERVSASLAAPIVIEGHLLSVHASIGIALFPEHGRDALTLLRRADVAMYTSKDNGGKISIYSSQCDHHNRDRIALSNELRTAVRQGQLVLHYQPQVELSSGEVVGVEALVRWQHPTRGIVPPDLFIGLAEQTGQMAELTAWVLEQAVRQIHTWRHTLGRLICVAVNISSANLQDSALLEQVKRLLAAYQIPADRLRVEVTEGMLMTDAEQANQILTQLAQLGVGVSIDDYGTGHSSLARLARLPVDELKIDRLFVRDMVRQETDAAIVASTVGLGHSLSLRVVAEGVEDFDTWEALCTLGCDAAQGYFFARPLPAPDLEAWMRLRAEALG